MKRKYDNEDPMTRSVRELVDDVIHKFVSEISDRLDLPEGDYILGFRIKDTNKGMILDTVRFGKENIECQHGHN